MQVIVATDHVGESFIDRLRNKFPQIEFLNLMDQNTIPEEFIMAEIIDADTHIIEHPGVWEYFSEKNYHRRPQLASVEATEAGGIRDFVWLINGNAVPKKHGKGSYAVAVGGSDSENNRTDIRNEVRYITDPKARVEDMDKRGVDKEILSLYSFCFDEVTIPSRLGIVTFCVLFSFLLM